MIISWKSVLIIIQLKLELFYTKSSSIKTIIYTKQSKKKMLNTTQVYIRIYVGTNR